MKFCPFISLTLKHLNVWADNKAHTDKDILNHWFDFLEHHTDFDQLIMETSNGRDYRIHISCKKNRSKNRHQVIRELKKKGANA